MTTACAVDQDLRRHQAQESDDEDFAAAVEARQKELMLPGGECDPLDADNFAEALFEQDGAFAARLAVWIRDGRDNYVAAALHVMAAKHMAPKAATVAEKQIQHEIATRCPSCKDAGCVRCEGEY